MSIEPRLKIPTFTPRNKLVMVNFYASFQVTVLGVARRDFLGHHFRLKRNSPYISADKRTTFPHTGVATVERLLISKF